MKTARWALWIAGILLGMLILAQIFGLPTGLISGGLLWLVAAVAGWVLVFFLPKITWRISTRALLIAGGVNLLALLLPTALLVELHINLGRPELSAAGSALGALLYLLPCAALVLVTMLLRAGVQAERPERESAACLLLAALLLVKTLHNFYWLLAWDNTYDPLDLLWMIPPVFISTVAALSLLVGLNGRARWVGLYALFIPALLVAVAGNGDQIDFRQLTQRRADRIAARLEIFRKEQGDYPTELRDLTPRYLLAIPGPMTMYARQGWCYVSDGRGYQLGAVYRNHWSEPLIYPKIFAEAGAITADLPPLCSTELAALRPVFADFIQFGMSDK